MDSDDGGTSVEIGPSLAGMTLDGELEGLADSEAAGSTDVLAMICSVVLAESVAGILEALAESRVAGCSAEIAESSDSPSDSA